jgi:dienelactone hydrolase
MFVAALVCACSSRAPEPDPTCAGAAPYTARGAYASGVTTIDVEGVPVEIWYPVDRSAVEGRARDRYDMRVWLPEEARAKIPDEAAPLHEVDAYRDVAPSTAGTYPLVLFSHGLGGYRSQASFVATHLASWGFVVVAPDHPERGLAQVLRDIAAVDDQAPAQLRAALRRMKQENTAPGGRFAGRIDLGRVAAMGHSMGGAAVTDLLAEPDIRTGIFLASPGFGPGPEGKAILMMGGTKDGFATQPSMESAFLQQPMGKRYVSLRDAGHLAFTDTCVIGKERGGVLAIAVAHGVEVNPLLQKLARDGCEEDELPAEQAWPVVAHFVVAELRATLGIDSPPRGFGESANRCFGDRIAAYEEK